MNLIKKISFKILIVTVLIVNVTFGQVIGYGSADSVCLQKIKKLFFLDLN